MKTINRRRKKEEKNYPLSLKNLGIQFSTRTLCFIIQGVQGLSEPHKQMKDERTDRRTDGRTENLVSNIG